ncbi:MAG: aminotransferase class V-fold PLP-dependent enzyme [Bacteroidota bacterium]
MSKNQFETEAIRTQLERSQYLEHSNPLYLTSSYVFEDAEDMRVSFTEEKKRNVYSRYSNPNTSKFIEKVCKMEVAESGYAFASGMSAVFSTFAALLNSGDHIVSLQNIFGSTQALFNTVLPKWQISTDYFGINELNKVEDLIQPNTKVIYAESSTNPGVDILDIQYLGDIAKRYNILLIIDNCFATPYLQQPIKFGADLVIHSATKLMDGQGRVLGGVTVGRLELIEKITFFARNSGPALSPFNAWVLSKSIQTLPVRVDKHCENALGVARFLESHKNVAFVKYPFLKSHPQHNLAKKHMRLGGSIVSFEIKGGIDAGRKFLDAIKLCKLSANLGDTRTIVTHPSSTTHAKLSREDRLKTGITDGLIRVSVGLEHIEDIIKDIKQALG